MGRVMLIRTKCAALSLILIAFAASGDVRVSPSHLGTLQESVASMNHIEVKLRLTQNLRDHWVFQITANNTGSGTVFIMTDPVRDDGSKGAYFAVDTQSPSHLEISSRLYPPPTYCTLAGSVHVMLRRLDPGESYTFEVRVSLPFDETSPPTRNPLDPKSFDSTKIKFARASIGVLPDEEGTQDFLKHKEGIGPYASPFDNIEKGTFKGKRLYELQTIALSQPIEIPDP
jgi:hypothetical protein